MAAYKLLVLVTVASLFGELTLGQSNWLELEDPSIFKFIQFAAKKDPVLTEKHLSPLVNDNSGILIGRLTNGTEDQDTCELCFDFVNLLRNESNGDYDSIRDVVVDTCIALLAIADLDLDGDVICPGIMDLQGPHLLEVIQASETSDLCENLNACSPLPEEIEYISPDIEKHIKEDKYKRPSSGTKRAQIKIAHVTDIHIDLHYAEGSSTDCGLFVCCRESYGEGTAGRYGNYNCNIPKRTVELFAETLSDMNPDFVLFSGDTPPHSIWDETFDSQLNCTKTLIDVLTEKASNLAIYPNIGNHEMYPTNLYYLPLEATRMMNKEYADLWQPFANFQQEQIDTMNDAGYYSITPLPGLRIISINSNYWYTLNWYNTLSLVRPEFLRMKNFIENELRDAQEKGEKVIIIGHHPLGRYDSIVVMSRWFRSLVSQYSDTIVLHVAGHTHSDEQKVFVDPMDGQPKGMLFVAPSVTTTPAVNPSLRVFTLDAETYQLLDYDQYHLDIMETLANPDEIPEIKHVYKATEEYGLSDMSPQSWLDLADRLAVDDDLFKQYEYNRDARSNTSSGCDATCRKGRVCFIKTSAYDDYLACTGAETNPQPALYDGVLARAEHMADQMDSGTTILAPALGILFFYVFNLILVMF